MKKKVIWTKEDKQYITDLLYKQRFINIEDSLLILLNKTIKLLPEEKRRKIYTLSHVKDIVEGIRERILDGEKAIEDYIKNNPQVVLEKIPLEILVKYGPLNSLLERNAEAVELVFLALDDIKTMLREKKKSVDQQVKMKVMVIGLLPIQQNVLKEKTKDLGIKYSFVDITKNVRNDPKWIAGMDIVILVSKFSNHKTEEAIKPHVTGIYVVHTHGLEMLIKKVRELCQG